MNNRLIAIVLLIAGTSNSNAQMGSDSTTIGQMANNGMMNSIPKLNQSSAQTMILQMNSSQAGGAYIVSYIPSWGSILNWKSVVNPKTGGYSCPAGYIAIGGFTGWSSAYGQDVNTSYYTCSQ